MILFLKMVPHEAIIFLTCWYYSKQSKNGGLIQYTYGVALWAVSYSKNIFKLLWLRVQRAEESGYLGGGATPASSTLDVVKTNNS